MDKLHEECGVFGVFAPVRGDLSHLAYYGLYALQHRGQESAGIAVNDDGVFRSWKDVGLVNEVFTPERLQALPDTVREFGPGEALSGIVHVYDVRGHRCEVYNDAADEHLMITLE